VRLSDGSYPFSSLSLGKQVLKYKAAATVTEEKGGLPQSSLPQNPQNGGQGDLTLTIPESLLTWRGDRSPGTQMLVFKATCAQKQPKKKPLHLYKFASRKGCRKNAVVEVNRLNFGQSLGRPKVSNQDAGEAPFVGEKPLGGTGVEKGPASSCLGTSCAQERSSTQTSSCPEIGSCNGDGNCRTAEAAKEDQNLMHDVACSAGNKGVGGGGTLGGGKGKGKQHSLLQQKKSKSKLKKVKIDAAVMTEISFGTENIPDMCHIPSPSKCIDYKTKANQSTGSFSAPTDPSFSPPIAQKGCVHRCTSPKLQFRNGSFNGVLNGYAVPEVTAALKARRDHRPVIETSPKKNKETAPKGKEETALKSDDDTATNSQEVPPKQQETPTQPTPTKRCTASPKVHKKGVIRKRIVRINNKIPVKGSSSAKFQRRKVKIPAGSGKRGMRSFLVSLPRLHYDSKPPSPAADGNAGAASPRSREEGKTRSTMGTHKRRSQTELLLDGDNPPGQRLSELGIPVFMAEDVSNRSSSSNGSHALWLESSTRKITPVEHFAYPIPTALLSPTKRNSGEVNGARSPFGNHRKRVSEVLEVDSPPPLLLPPIKQLKVASDTSSANRSGLEKAERSSNGIIQEDKCGEGKCAEKCVGMNGSEQPSPEHKAVTTPLKPAVTPTKKSEAAPPDSMAFSAELVVFDSRGECLVQDGSYSLLMQCCSGKDGLGLSTFEPLTWESVFGSGNEVSNTCSPFLR
jgi:hypothetical protein